MRAPRRLVSAAASLALAGCAATGDRFALPGLDAGFGDLETGVAWIVGGTREDAVDFRTGLAVFGDQVAQDSRQFHANVSGAPAWLARAASQDARDLGQTMAILRGDFAAELGDWADLVHGIPGWVAGEFRDGKAGIASFLAVEAEGISRDWRSVPSEARWLLEMGLR
jgi:hypothetical protein